MYGSPQEATVMPEADMLQYLEMAARHGIRTVSFTGGEPFTCPDLLKTGIEAAVEMGFDLVWVESAFLGRNEDEIQENARFLAEHNVVYVTSLNSFQKSSCPGCFDFEAQRIAEFSALLSGDVKMRVIGLYLPDHIQEASLFKQVFKEGLRAQLLTCPPESSELRELLGDNFYYIPEGVFDMQHHNVPLNIQYVSRVGRAYDKAIKPTEALVKQRKQPDFLLRCSQIPRPGEESVDLDQILVHPNGKVSFCCLQDRTTDFGLGNLKEDGWEGVIDIIKSHPLFTCTYPIKLEFMAKQISLHFPEAVPQEGFMNGCEVCNLYHKHPDIQKLLKSLVERG